MKKLSILALAFVFCFVGIVSLAGTANASTSRVAIISKLEGTVDVQKSSGKKTLKGFKNMSLNQGDVVTTGKDSMVVLKFSNGTSSDDTFVLESSTSVTFSKVSNSNGTTTKVKMLKGKAWVDVKSIQNKDDKFELETPTAIMGVRGTNFLVGVDPAHKNALLIVLSGIVQVNSSNNQNNSGQFIYPASAILFGSTNGESNSNSLPGSLNENIPITNINLEQFLSTTPTEVVQAFLENRSKIIEENDKFIRELTQGNVPNEINQFSITNEEYEQNVENLLLALAQVARQYGTLNNNQYNDLLEAINTSNRLDQDQLNGQEKKLPINLTPNQLTEEQLKAQEEAKQALLDSQKNGFLLEKQKQLQAELERQMKERAEQQYLAKLSEQERLQFERDKLERLKEQSGSITPPTQPVTGTSPPSSGGGNPSQGWDSVSNPYTITYREEGESEYVVELIKENSLTYANVPAASNDTAHLVFSSSNSRISVDAVTVDGQVLEKSPNNNFVMPLDYYAQTYLVQIKLTHSSYGSKTFTLQINTEEAPAEGWESISEPFAILYRTEGAEDFEAEIRDDGGIGYVDVPEASNDQTVLLFTSFNSEVTIANASIDGEELIYSSIDNAYLLPLAFGKQSYIVELQLEHTKYEGKIIYVNVSTEGWSNVSNPFTVTYRTEGAEDFEVAVRDDGGISYVDVPEASNDQTELLFTSANNEVTIESARVAGELLPYDSTEEAYKMWLDFGKQNYVVELQLSHSEYGEKRVYVYVNTEGWGSVIDPISVAYRTEGAADAPVELSYEFNQGYAYVPEPNNDVTELLFSSGNSEITIESVYVNEELLEYNVSEQNYSLRLDFDLIFYYVELNLTHSKYGEMTYYLNVYTQERESEYDPWEDIINPFTIIRSEEGQSDVVVDTFTEGDYTYYNAYVHRAMNDQTFLKFTSLNSAIQLNSVSIGGERLEYNITDNIFEYRLDFNATPFIALLEVTHELHGARLFVVNIQPTGL